MVKLEHEIRVGVLALQGGFSEHISHLKRSIQFLQDAGQYTSKEYEVLEVRSSSDLQNLDGLVVPGGESGTMSFFLENYPDLLEGLQQFSKSNKPIFGTCAGMILLANHVEGQKQNGQILIGGLDIKVKRNYYGSQCQSFEGTPILNSQEFVETESTPTIFIRAPGIASIQEDADVKILAKYKDSIVAVRQKNLVATSFHPELTENLQWHLYFLRIVISNL